MKWLFFIYFTACQTITPTKIPLANIWNGRVYVGDSLRLGVSRNAIDPVVACSSQEFNHMICMSAEDYTALMQYFLEASCAVSTY